MSMPNPRPIIVIKKVSGHEAQHSGAWKVAYADFVTAMMALFIVLWLMGTSSKVKQSVAGYFNDPKGTSTNSGTDNRGTADNLPLTEDNLDKLKEQIQKSMQEQSDLSALLSQIEVTVTPEGLRIELLESKDGTFFNTGSSVLNDNGKKVLLLLSKKLGDVPNHLSIEGHTDSAPFAESASYGNWELSADRANAARRLMQQDGLRSDQVSQVRGYADQRLRTPEDPMDPANRRVSLIVQYLEGPANVKTPGQATPAAPVPVPGKAAPASGAKPVPKT
jgi:chemotaxis protein MotB